MYLRMIYDDRLAQAAYLIGCQATGEAIVIDPERDVDRYLEAARAAGLRIAAVAETHIHADFVSGARELAERTGAHVYVSGAGGPDWQSRWLDAVAGQATRLADGDTFSVGRVELLAMHTPGHTPEHMCYVVTDRGAGASEPIGVCTGDFLFVGDMGRPDLLERAVGVGGSAEGAARDLHRSCARLGSLPDFVQVWPAHGAGSACGKALGAVPQSTLGYERRFNPALRAARDEQAFLAYILADQPDPPLYFARMKAVNRDGPRLLGPLPRPAPLGPDRAAALLDGGAVAIDTRPWDAFRAGHLPGSVFAPVDGMFVNAVGAYLQPDDRIVLVAQDHAVEPAVRLLVRIGLDHVEGYVRPEDLAQVPRPLEESRTVDIDGFVRALGDGSPVVIDVRNAGEYAQGHVRDALNAPYHRLPEFLPQIPRDRTLLVHCRSGGRSARAVAFLQRKGYRAVNVEGGFLGLAQHPGARPYLST